MLFCGNLKRAEESPTTHLIGNTVQALEDLSIPLRYFQDNNILLNKTEYENPSCSYEKCWAPLRRS